MLAIFDAERTGRPATASLRSVLALWGRVFIAERNRDFRLFPTDIIGQDLVHLTQGSVALEGR